MAEFYHSGLVMNLQHGPKILLCNLNFMISAVLCSLT